MTSTTRGLPPDDCPLNDAGLGWGLGSRVRFWSALLDRHIVGRVVGAMRCTHELGRTAGLYGAWLVGVRVEGARRVLNVWASELEAAPR